jgi:hypothetical protein
LPQPGSHVTLHAPPMQTEAPLTSPHKLPQIPQFALLVARLVSQPLSVTPSQLPQPALQALIMHTPPRQAVTALGNVQVQPHWCSIPPPPHVSGAVQEPQSTSPHPLSSVPQFAPS